MTNEELEYCKDNQIPGEDINQTYNRLFPKKQKTFSQNSNPVEPPKSVFPEPEKTPDEYKNAPAPVKTAPAPAKTPASLATYRQDTVIPYNPEQHRPGSYDEEGFGEEDISICRLKIIQPSSRDSENVGNFRNTMTGDETESLPGTVFLLRRRGRVLFPDGDFSGERVCWSLDGFQADAAGIERIYPGQKPLSPACVSMQGRQKIVHCEHAMFAKDEAGKTRPPACKETCTFLGILEDFTPFWISFHGMGLSPVKKFLNTIYLKKMQGQKRGQPVNMRDFKITLTLQKEQNEKGKYYIPIFSNLVPVTEEEKQELAELFEVFKDREAPVDEDLVEVAPPDTSFNPEEYE